MTLDLETRIAKLEAADDIRRLKARYAEVCDDGYDPGRLTQLFTKDAIWDAGPDFGRHIGHEAIYRFFDEVSGRITWASHLMIDPTIEVADDLENATGKWYLFEPCTMTDGDRDVPTWISGVYTDTYKKEDGAWKFAEVNLVLHFISPHDDGWVKTQFLGR